MKTPLLSAVSLGICALLLTSCQATPNMLSLSKTTFSPGENIEVKYMTDTTNPTAWIGVIPSSTPHGSEEENDAVDISYVYLDGVKSGTQILQAPTTPGAFDLRLNDSDTSGKEVASVSFTVTD